MCVLESSPSSFFPGMKGLAKSIVAIGSTAIGLSNQAGLPSIWCATFFATNTVDYMFIIYECKTAYKRKEVFFGAMSMMLVGLAAMVLSIFATGHIKILDFSNAWGWITSVVVLIFLTLPMGDWLFQIYANRKASEQATAKGAATSSRAGLDI